MATGTAGDTGQRYHTNQVHQLIKTVTYEDYGTSNIVKVGVLPPRAIVQRGEFFCITSFDDTNGDDIDVGVSGSDADLFVDNLPVGTSLTTTTFDDLADANRYSASARTVTTALATAASGNGTVGEVVIIIDYTIAP